MRVGVGVGVGVCGSADPRNLRASCGAAPLSDRRWLEERQYGALDQIAHLAYAYADAYAIGGPT
jgi:hypothetical protein